MSVEVGQVRTTNYDDCWSGPCGRTGAVFLCLGIDVHSKTVIILSDLGFLLSPRTFEWGIDIVEFYSRPVSHKVNSSTSTDSSPTPEGNGLRDNSSRWWAREEGEGPDQIALDHQAAYEGKLERDGFDRWGVHKK